MYYGQWEGVHRMPIGGPRLKRLGTAELIGINFIIQIPLLFFRRLLGKYNNRFPIFRKNSQNPSLF